MAVDRTARSPRPAARRFLYAALALVAGFLLVTYWALEAGGVAVVETRSVDGSVRTTRVWYANDGKQAWLEAGTPENPWYLDVLRDPALTLVVDGRSAHYVAVPDPGRSAHEHVRALLRAKYGLRDLWVGLLVDGTRSVAVRIDPMPGQDVVAESREGRGARRGARP